MNTKWFLYARRAASYVAGLYLARLMVRMGWVKFDPEGFWTPAFEEWGYPAWLRVLVGVVEVGGGLMLLIPWVATYGGVALAVVMVGAGVTRFTDGAYGDVLWILAYGLGCLWVAFEWRAWRWPQGRTAREHSNENEVQA